MKHLNLTVTGRVQGVFFRASTREKAAELGVTGWVMNTQQGQVYIEVEGSENQLEAFVAWCRKGPRLAKVTNIEIAEAPVNQFQDFQIKY